MEIDILYRPSYSMGVIKLSPNEVIRTEAGSMVSSSVDVSIETKATGGFLKSMTRSVLGGESFFLNDFRASEKGGEIALAPPLPGDMQTVDLKNEKLMVQSGSYLASEIGIEIETKWSGAKTFFASEGLIMLRISGSGKLLLCSYGAIHEKDLAEHEKFRVDTGHLVAFQEGIGFEVRRVGGWKSTLLSGEGLVVELTGPGRVLLQSRSTDSFLNWLIPKIPHDNN